MKTVLSLFIMTLLVSACGSGAQKASVTDDSRKAKIQEAPQFFSPNTLDENDIVIEKKEPVKAAEKPVREELPVVKIVQKIEFALQCLIK